MTKKELINRWKSRDGVMLLKAVLTTLKRNKALHEISGIEMFEGRLDLRGVVLSTVEDERTIGTKEHSLTQKFGSFRLKRTKFENVDFSNADISYGMFQECTFENCLFSETKAREINIYASDFNHCIFTKANFSYSFMNMNIGSNAGSFMNCKFLNTSLKETIFSFPVMDNCIFDNCDLHAADFDGTRMRNVKFIGVVDSPWFRGYSTSAQKSLFWLFNKVNPRDYPNKMENVDFSEAKLIGVSFSDSIDLSHTRFPDSNDYILVKNLNTVFSAVKNEIRDKWEGEDQSKGLHMIEHVYYTHRHAQQDATFIDKFVLVEDFDLELADETLLIEGNDKAFADKLFEVIRRHNSIPK